ncbi:DNA (cytosine-5)-methyltransferase 1 [Pasteurella testudinis DSM 23072]|uniref:Cytosine-specific methyltransferase n=2 Tax=Pasteurella testudinis TaxID=761 RepID=A0A1W1UEY4_9PAST|nr:DNA (cytosine-5)-methyltransferase 1 [Pasteurella testudinis DSM 23072]SUB50788.1 Modification methylase HaeIII [Pasteurella testudinis]
MYKVIDLFAGAGGLSLGAARAGFKIQAAIEIDSIALETHSNNFLETLHFQKDISELSGDELLKMSNLKSGDLSGLIGGPPCQGFSTIGKGNVADSRNTLFQHFFRLVDEIKPEFFVAENVVGILNPKYDSIRIAALEKIKNEYTILNPIKIKASELGAPTTRTRIFFIGYKKNTKNNLSVKDFSYKETEIINVENALFGLPININPNWQTPEKSWQKIKLSEFPNNKFFDNVIGNIPSGIGNPMYIKRYLEQEEVSGCSGTRHSKIVEHRYKQLKYGQQDKISKSQRLNPKGFCPTLRAGTGSDKGSFQAVRPIHYSQPRVITPREAARLQGFPDWFVFHNTKWHSFRQIGNSVSPIVAEKILSTIMNKLLIGNIYD